MLSQSSSYIQCSSHTQPEYPGRTRPAPRIISLTCELADELDRFDTEALGPAGLRVLMHGMVGTASALTRILDHLRESSALARPEDELTLPPHQTVRSELDQAAAAAEDLQVTAESLCRLLPAEMIRPTRRSPGPRP
jgi:hypothetical protein